MAVVGVEGGGLGLDFPEGHTRGIEGPGHLDLIGDAEVPERLRVWLGASSTG